MGTHCPICSARCDAFASTLVLSKHRAELWRCVDCGSVHFPDPHWLDEAYEDAIASTDIGLASRAMDVSNIVSLVVSTFFRDARRFIDYAGGNGLLVRLMRDRGFDFSWYDPFAENLFARSFVGNLDATYDLATAIEVLEHLTEPTDTLGSLRSLAPALIATTEVLPDPAPRPDDWWYYSLSTGQHVTFYTARGLEALASSVGWCVTTGGTIHVFAERELSPTMLRLATSGQVARSLTRWTRRPSLLPTDYEALTGQKPV